MVLGAGWFAVRHPVRCFVRCYLRAQQERYRAEAFRLLLSADVRCFNERWELSEVLGLAAQIVEWDGEGSWPGSGSGT